MEDPQKSARFGGDVRGIRSSHRHNNEADEDRAGSSPPARRRHRPAEDGAVPVRDDWAVRPDTDIMAKK